MINVLNQAHKPLKNMTSRILSVVCLICLAITFIHCGGDDPKPEPEPTQVEKVTAMLTEEGGTWTPSGSAGITVDGVDVTSDLFEGFAITFGESTFTTTGTTPVWLRTDTWEFTDESATAFTRGQDGKTVTITTISDTQLKLTLEWDQTTYEEGGRKRSIPGTYQFILNK
jgi:hypothetical protein